MLLFQDLKSNNYSSSTRFVDGCGEVHRLSEQAKILTLFYYLPLVVFCVLLVIKLWRKLMGNRITQMIQRRFVCAVHRIHSIFTRRKHKKLFNLWSTSKDTSMTSIGTTYLEFDDSQALLTYATNHN